MSPIKYLASAYTRLKDTKRHKYGIVSIQTLLRLLSSPSMDIIHYVIKFRMKSASHLIGLSTPNTSATHDTPLPNQCMPYSSRATSWPAHPIHAPYPNPRTGKRARCPPQPTRPNIARHTNGAAVNHVPSPQPT